MIDVENEIMKFLSRNAIDDEIDLTNLFVGTLIYNPINSFNISMSDLSYAKSSTKFAIVFEKETEDGETLYIDIFNKRIYRKTTYEIPKVITYVPLIRTGLTIYDVEPLKEILSVEKASIEKIKETLIDSNEAFEISTILSIWDKEEKDNGQPPTRKKHK